jgi:hypothetical protein
MVRERKGGKREWFGREREDYKRIFKLIKGV